MSVIRIILALFMLSLSVHQAQGAGNCVGPGDVLDVPTPGFLRNDTPNLFLRFDLELHPADLISHTTSRLRIRMPMTGLPGSSNFKVVHIENNGQHKVVANASTCDNWGGGGGGGGSLRDTTRIGNILDRRDLAPGAPATRNEVAAPSGGPEYLVLGSATEVTSAQVILLNEGVTILRSSSLTSLGVRMSAVDLNGVISLGELRSLMAQNDIAVTVDKHTVYGAAGRSEDYAGSMVGIENPETCSLQRTVRIGIIDGPIDTTHPALYGVPIFSESVLNQGERLGSTDHATGIASLIAAVPGTDVPPGLARGSQIFSVIAFARSGARDVARLENIAQALDWLVSRQVEVVNMSLAGPRNATLEQIVRIASGEGLILVAATGNGRQNGVSYPASDPLVFAITAIDAAKRLYRRANYGNSVDFAAPGVDLQVAGKRGVSIRSGTSYASAIATALIAQEIARGTTSYASLSDLLQTNAEDLGVAGRDPQFGWGLINIQNCR